MRFNADAYVSALEPPVFVTGGVEHVGRIVSFEEWIPFERRLTKYRTGGMLPHEAQRLLRDLADLIFPPPPRPRVPWWRRRLGRRPPPAAPSVGDALAALPMPVQLEALAGFIASQVSAVQAAVEHLGGEPMTAVASRTPSASGASSTATAPTSTTPPDAGPPGTA